MGPVKFEVSVMQVGGSLRITIPREIANHLDLGKGDMVEVWVDDHNIVIERKIALYDAIWGFMEDILEMRERLGKRVKAHTSQPLGVPLHKYRGQLTIDRGEVLLRGEDSDSKEASSFLFSIEELKDAHIGWDDTLRRWKDTRAWIRPLRLTFKGEVEDRTVYIYAKKPSLGIYGEENDDVYKILRKSSPTGSVYFHPQKTNRKRAPGGATSSARS